MNIKKSIAKLLSGNVFVTASNLIRDITIASVFGATYVVDMFFLFISIPVFFITIVTNAMRNVCVPILVEADKGEGEELYGVLAKRLLFSILKYASAIILLITLAFLIVYYISGFDGNTIEIPLGVWLALSIIPMYCLAFVIESSQGILQVKDMFFLPVISRLGMPVGIILGAFLLTKNINIYALGVGGFFGSIIGLILIVYSFSVAGVFASRLILKLPYNTYLRFKKNLFLLILGAAITYVNPVVDQWMSSFYGEGSVAYIGYANRLTIGVASIIMGSISPVILGYYSEAFYNNQKNKIQSVFDLSFTAFTWVGSYMTLSCWFVSKIGIDFLYGHGVFSSDDVKIVSKLMNCYSVQFPFLFASTATYTLIAVVSKNEWFIKFGIIMFVVNIIGNIILGKYYGLFGIACSTVIVYSVSIALMCRNLHLEKFIYLRIKKILEALLAICALFVVGGYLYSIDYWSYSSVKDLLRIEIVFAVYLWLVYGLVTYKRARKALNF